MSAPLVIVRWVCTHPGCTNTCTTRVPVPTAPVCANPKHGGRPYPMKEVTE